MKTGPEFVCTGIEFKSVHCWARVNVGIDRFAQVQKMALEHGTILLEPGETLSIEVDAKSDVAARNQFAVRVGSQKADRSVVPGMVCWNGVLDIKMYADEVPLLERLYPIVKDALSGHSRSVDLDGSRIGAVKVGKVSVHFIKSRDPS